jgi:hypothetical protein
LGKKIVTHKFKTGKINFSKGKKKTSKKFCKIATIFAPPKTNHAL